MRRSWGWLSFVAGSAGVIHAQGPWVNVWNGSDGTGLTRFGSGAVTYNPGTGGNAGTIRASGGNGYLRTNAEYSHYRVRFEWNMVTSGGNSGFLYHILTDRVWPLGLECQTGLGDAGSLWTTGARFNSTGSSNTYSPTGPAVNQYGTDGTSRNRFARSSNAYLGDGQWNAFEMFVKADSMEMKINNTVVMRIWRLTINNGTALNRGRIALQIEGATVDFRNWQIMDLANPISIAPHLRHLNPAAPALFFGAAGMPVFQRLRPEGRVQALSLNGRVLAAFPLTP